jgi:hypothetical protein
MLNIIFLFLSSVMPATPELIVKDSWSMRSPTNFTNSTNITCGEQEYVIAYGYTSHTELASKGNRFYENRGPLKLKRFEASAFEVTETLFEKLNNAVAAYSRLDHINLNCGWRIDDEETDFLSMKLVGRHKGDLKSYKKKCIEGDGIFFDETSRTYILKDGELYDMNKSEKLGHCIYGQEFFSLELEIEQ